MSRHELTWEELTRDAATAAVPGAAPGISPRTVLFPYAYLLLVVVAAMDLALTYMVILIGGMEVNPLARLVLHSPADFQGLIVYKYVLVTLVILIAEFIGRHAPPTAKRLTFYAIAISAFPVVWSTLLLSQHLG